MNAPKKKLGKKTARPKLVLELPTPGMPSVHVIEELRRCYREAKDYAAALNDAIKAQAEKHKLKAGALRKYVAALEGDKIPDAAAEAADIERLIGIKLPA